MFFFTDWEGPWILTDFAFELAMAAFNNDRFFKNLSLYDDYLAYEVKREGYEAGYTMKLLAPFIAAVGFKNEDLERIARLSARFVPHAKEAMEFLKARYKPVVISTSYMQYLKVTASMLGIDEHIYGSEADFDSLNVGELGDELIKSVDVIASLDGDELYSYLDKLFNREDVREIVDSVKAIGAGEKAEIVRRYCEEYNIDRPIAVGDSISDYKMFEEVRKLGGISVAFNGNEYALKHADVAIISNSAVSEAIVIYALMKGAEVEKLEEFEIPSEFGKLLAGVEVEIFLLDSCDKSEVVKKSKRMRVRLRGEAGLLG